MSEGFGFEGLTTPTSLIQEGAVCPPETLLFINQRGIIFFAALGGNQDTTVLAAHQDLARPRPRAGAIFECLLGGALDFAPADFFYFG